MQFEESKRRILENYEDALSKGVVDDDMIAINEAINVLPDFVTTSSCFGRMTLISKTAMRDKYHTNFHFKTHQPSAIDLQVTELPEFDGTLWLLVEAPNIHVRSKNLDAASELQKLGLQAKLSKSKFQSLKPAIVVELLGTGSLQIPLGQQGEILISQVFLEMVEVEARELLSVEQERLRSFHQLILNYN